jgi:hypothetical protein
MMSVTNLELKDDEFEDDGFIENENDDFEDSVYEFENDENELEDESEDGFEIDKLEDEVLIEKIFDHYCDICDHCYSHKSKLIEHLKSLKHKVKLERLEIFKNTDGSICSIPIRNKKGIIICYTTVDKDVYPFIMNYSISKTTGDYAIININNKSFSLHRYIYYKLGNRKPTPNTVIDHRDHNRLNNILSNLQETTNANNVRNRDKKENCTSKHYGVSKRDKRWICALKHNDIRYYFSYNNELHAAYHHDLLVKEFGLDNYSPLNNIECPDGFIIKTKDIKKDGLPKNIYTSGSKYRCRFQGKLSDNSKSGFETIEDAVSYRDDVLEKIDKEKIDELNKSYDGPIERNPMGIAIMNVFNDKNEVIAKTLLDDDIYCYLVKHNRVLGLDKDDYVRVFINGKSERLHRWIIKYSDELMVDHEDSNTLNNQRLNLRISTSVQNAQNKSSCKGALSKYVGVSMTNNRKKWKVDIEGKYLGVFDTEEEAVLVRNKKAQELNDQGARYKIEIYNGPTIKIEDKPLKIEDNPLKIESNLIKINQFDNKQIIINKNIIDKEYIMNINKVNVLYNLVITKKLNAKNEGPIKVKDIKLENLDEYKKIIIDTLYPS